jgi:hypothetical protein
MIKRIICGLVFSILSGAFIAGCKTTSPTDRSLTNENISQRDNTTSSKQITELVETFSEDVGPEGQQAWRKLRAYSEMELISELEQLKAKASPSDKLRPKIAFVYCWLDRDYETNVKIIESALSKSPPYQGFYADDAESLLDRLIEHGKKDLLKPLFDSVSWSDGALAEGLGVTFARELQNDPEQFLSQLSTYPSDTRKTVYFLIQPSDVYTDSELSDLRKRLSNIPKTSAAYEPAKEFLRTLSLKASK